ncbi:DUF1516 family protein [Apilactobacillus ozensis]|uniref:DUF1516 family protein n=1 Tax=Apilactobacillus ozensis TaxID=866801 RepID=UPI00200AE666|nr:DUF1516 family protein [Apilactobacillus ozensis]MCK8607420.1 YisL family protein [Apilactobacillus ozensis]
MWIHLLVAVLFIFTFVLGLVKHSGYTVYQMISRFCYLIFIVTGGFLAFKAFHRSPFLISLKIIIALIFIAALEYGFAKKNHKNLDQKTFKILIFIFVILILVGLLAAGGRPFM